jgi:hypothetical protein
MLQFCLAERQAEAAAHQAAAAERMIQPTRDLAKFTQGLVRATWALFFVAGATVLLTAVQVLKAVGWMK